MFLDEAVVDEFLLPEPVRDFLLRLGDGTRRVDKIPHSAAVRVAHEVRVEDEVAADGADVGGEWLRAARNLPHDADRVRALPDHGDDRATRHVALEVREDFCGNFERVRRGWREALLLVARDGLLPRHAAPLRVECVVLLHLRLGGDEHSDADELQARALVTLHNFADERPLEAVRLHDDEGAFFAEVRHAEKITNVGASIHACVHSDNSLLRAVCGRVLVD